MDNQEIDRIMSYTEDVAEAIEVLQSSDQFYLVWADGDGGWHRRYNGARLMLLGVLKICADELGDDLRNDFSAGNDD